MQPPPRGATSVTRLLQPQAAHSRRPLLESQRARRTGVAPTQRGRAREPVTRHVRGAVTPPECMSPLVNMKTNGNNPSVRPLLHPMILRVTRASPVATVLAVKPRGWIRGEVSLFARVAPPRTEPCCRRVRCMRGTGVRRACCPHWHAARLHACQNGTTAGASGWKRSTHVSGCSCW